MIRQTTVPLRESTQLPTPIKCYTKTAYPLNKYEGETITRVTWPTCIYLKNGKCQLNGCIKNYGRGRDGYREDNSRD